MAKLPKVNELGFFEIRLESIGGLGANLAGKMLSEDGVVGNGLNGVGFSSYGSEKKGSPVKAYIRFCDPVTHIRDTTPIERPHVVGIFHEALLKTTDCASGIYPDSTILVNSQRSPDELRQLMKIDSGTIAVVNATEIALEEQTKVNTTMLGALYRILDFLDPDSMKDTIRRTFEKKYPHFVEPNIRTFDRGFDEIEFMTFEPVEGTAPRPFKRFEPALGYQTQPIGGTITNPGNSILKDLSISRAGMLPHFHDDKCINCAACDTVCPDFCFVWEEKEDKRGRPQMFLKGIDYQYCKGCLKCVQACPVEALTDEREYNDGYADKNRVPHLFDLMSQN
ncbi:2-oxoacid:acceptor oxidoreductase family protein [Pseudalkalibacillus salsuginis]|uniref:2-oxoacid:acceptor oxidoreductase family protein n=1 Tax=Pseudalkalibacillus salsuginis TaxID=2910972 RepID=UPI001F44105D|nr:2-oxoacid:acceptor oxidoreductase family protein [Pseudalkalibacillus salsuginis]MCF6410284.1 2-oxoacid:acceptor oxidoreductase family protein [Pseudalkalibacillus salsuginis]